MATLRASRTRGKSHRPSQADAVFLRRRFAAYVQAVQTSRWSEAVQPRNDLAEHGFELYYRPRQGGGR